MIWMTPLAVMNDPALSRAEFRFVVQGTSGIFRSPDFSLESARAQSGLTGTAGEPEGSGNEE